MQLTSLIHLYKNNIDIPGHTRTVEINLNKSRDNINTEFNLIRI